LSRARVSSFHFVVRPVAIAAVLVAGLAGGAAAAVRAHHTRAGMALARQVLLHRNDLGDGWSAGGVAKAVPELTCPAFSPSLSGVVETGAVNSPTFMQGVGGPLASETAYAYQSVAQGQIVWQKVAKPRLLRCVAATLAHGSSDGVKFKVTGMHLLRLPGLPVNAAGYRVAGTAMTSNQTIDVFLDAVLLGHGKIVTEISIASFATPVARAVEVHLAKIVARRVAAR